MCGTKLCFTSSYNPQSDLTEGANRQVLGTLRVAVATVVQYDEWDEALPHVTFDLNIHVTTGTNMSPFESAHGFLAHVPLTMDLSNSSPSGNDRHGCRGGGGSRRRREHHGLSEANKFSEPLDLIN